MEAFDELKRQLLSMGYPEQEIDDVLARMRAEEQQEALHHATMRDDARTSSDDA